MCSLPLYGLPGLPRVESALAIRQSSQSTGGARGKEVRRVHDRQTQNWSRRMPKGPVRRFMQSPRGPVANCSSHWRPQTRCCCWPCVALSLGRLGRGTPYAAVRGHEQLSNGRLQPQPHRCSAGGRGGLAGRRTRSSQHTGSLGKQRRTAWTGRHLDGSVHPPIRAACPSEPLSVQPFPSRGTPGHRAVGSMIQGCHLAISVLVVRYPDGAFLSGA